MQRDNWLGYKSLWLRLSVRHGQGLGSDFRFECSGFRVRA